MGVRARTVSEAAARTPCHSRLTNETRAEEFNVDLPFLLQQAAWLYERQLSQVKAQLRKVSKPSLTAHSPTPSSVSGSGVAGGHAMARTSSGGKYIRPVAKSHLLRAFRPPSTIFACYASEGAARLSGRKQRSWILSSCTW